MENYNDEMIKSLTSLIDETLEEIEEIKKSKFAATEIQLGASEAGMAGKSKNGELDAKKAEDEEEEDEEEDKMDKADDKANDDPADSDKTKQDLKDLMNKEEDEEDEEEEEEEEEKEMKMKKSLEDSESLMKSYVDERFNSLTETLSKMQAAIESLADQPVGRKGVPAGVAPLQKSVEEIQPLNKSQVANKLFELKKSGQSVDSADIFSVETANDLSTVYEIANKYGLN